MDCHSPGSSVHGVSQAGILEYWVGILGIPSPGDFPHPGIKPTSPALAAGFLTTELPGKPNNNSIIYSIDLSYSAKCSITSF